MKNTIRIIFFISILSTVLFFFRAYMGNIVALFSVFITLSVIFIAFIIFFENRHPTQTLTWLVVLGSFPVVGFIFYIFFGRNYRKERSFRKKDFLDKQAFSKIEGKFDPAIEEKLDKVGPHQRKLFYLAQQLSNSPISFATATDVLTDGDETFTSILEELEKANHHIHLEYYIVRHNEIGQEIKDVLIKKRQEGVIVRFLYDAVGSWKLSKAYIQELLDAGVEVVPFGPVRLPSLNSKINFRNHRKIIVIDGNIGFVGGLNIGDEYLGKDPTFGFWRDTHLKIQGEAVRSLQLIFLQDWYYMTNENLLRVEYLSPELRENVHGGVQLIAGGPDNEWSTIKNIFFSMISTAKESVWIASPYFIPDEDIFTAIKVAALSGLDVRLLVPERPDKWIVFHASRSYFPQLLQAGVKVYEYEKGFMHSKIVIVDGRFASIGTSNMDMRSFHLNFEVNAFLYRTGSTSTLVSDFENDLLHSNMINLEEFEKRNFGLKILESTSRLMSPLL